MLARKSKTGLIKQKRGG